MAEGLININGDSVQTLEIIYLTTLISLFPTLVVMMTSFTRYVITCSFIRSAMGTQQVPPNIVLIGISLILTLFTMTPTLDDIKTYAYDPYVAERITQEEFFDRAQVPIKDFMLRQTPAETMQMYCELSDTEYPKNDEEALELPMHIVIAAFITNELKRAFEIGFYLYIPFMLIDIVVSSTLMSMGMIMLPPSMISMPFKLLLFVALDGWQLLFSTLVQGFR